MTVSSMRRMRARLSLIHGKGKLIVTLVLITSSLLVADYCLGIISIVLEKDFETEFSYPLDIDNFPALIENFRNGEAVDHEPINRLYSKPRFLEKADSSCDDFHFLLIITVKSAPSNFKNRNAIRSTWGNAQYLKNISNFIKSKKITTLSSSNKNVLPRHRTREPKTFFKLVFLVGLIPNQDGGDNSQNIVLQKNSGDGDSEAQVNDLTKSKDTSESHHSHVGGIKQKLEEDINNESALHKDIVRTDAIDSYTNNTFKTMMAIRFLEEICTDYEYALLADDDMYISVKNLLTFLESPATYPDGETETSGSDTIGQIVDANRLFAGKVIFNKPIRQRIGANAKWHLSLDEYPYNHFPRYLPAGAIVMSKQVVEDFYYASYYTKHFRFDDIFLGIMAYKMNIIPFSCSYFHVCHSEDGKCPGLVIAKRQVLDGSIEDETSEDLSVIEQMEHVIARHGVSPEQLIDIWRELTLSGRI